MADWQGTVRDVVTYNAATNVTTIANHKVYEAFGKVFSETSATVDTIFGYTGRFYDDDTGLKWNTNRWYDPGVGQWISEDPIGFAAGDPNLYRYVGNSPEMFGDPSGLDEKQCGNAGLVIIPAILRGGIQGIAVRNDGLPCIGRADRHKGVRLRNTRDCPSR